MNVPLLDLQAQHAPLQERLAAALQGVLASHIFIQGPEVVRLEERLAEYQRCRHAIAVSSGTDALLIALMALGIGPGDEVVTTTYSFFATAGVIARVGARIVLVDIDPVSYNIDPDALAAAITPRTRAIIPVHLYGQMADVAPIMAVADRHGIPVIEDAAQAVGAEYHDGRRSGQFGAMTALSFYPSKNLGGCGEGGMVLTNDDTLAAALRTLRVHGAGTQYYHTVVGGNFRLDAFQGAVLNVKLDHLDEWTAARQAAGRRYDALFAERGLIAAGHITPPAALYAASGTPHYHVYNQYISRVQQRDALRAHLQAAGIGNAVYYPVPFHLQTCFASLGHTLGDFPHAEAAAAETVALPMGPTLSAEQQVYVADTIAAFYRA